MDFFTINRGITEEEFKYLFDNYFEQIKRFIFYKSGDEELASDITQEVFLKIWEQRGGVKKESVLSLLYTMAERLFISRWRKNKVALKFAERLKNQSIEADSVELDYLYEETKEKYERILSNMSENQREVFLMSRIDDLTYKEIAERLQISVKAVEKRMSKALEILRSNLEI